MSDILEGQKTEEELWQEYKKTKSQKIRDIFVRQYMPLVKYVAGRLAVNMPASVEYDDLVGFGQFGLLDAITKFDPDKNVKLKPMQSLAYEVLFTTSCDSLTGCHVLFGKNLKKSKQR